MSSLFHPVNAVLDKLSKQTDVDIRFMCLRDLAAELNRMQAYTMQQQQQQQQSASNAAAAAVAPPPSLSPPPPPLHGTAQIKLCRVLQVQLLCTQGEVSEAAVRCLPGLLWSVGDGALLTLLDGLLQAAFTPARTLPPAHLQDEEIADEREQEARLESIRMKALNSIKIVWTELSQQDAQAQVARKVIPPVVRLIQQSTDKRSNKSKDDDATSSSSPTLPLLLSYPTLSLSQLVDFVSFLSSLLRAHPSALVPFHSSILSLCHSVLLYPGAGLLQLNLDCLGAVAPHLSQQLIGDFVTSLTKGWGDFQTAKREGACVAALGVLVRVSGNAFQPYLGAVLPLLVQLLARDDEASEETRESALLCLESIIRCAGAAALPHMQSLVPSIQRAANYDPNYVGGGEDSADGPSQTRASQQMQDTPGDDGDGDDDDDGEDYGLGGGDDDEEDDVLNEFVDDGGDEGGNVSDDEDSSWKVRRAAARCIQALLNVVVVAYGSASEQQQQAFASSLPPLYVSTHAATLRPLVVSLAASLASLLLPRLTERTDYIQVDLLSHYEQLLLWATRNCREHDFTRPTDAAAGSVVTLQSQLTRLLSTPIKAKHSASDIRTLEQTASLLSTATRCQPAEMWSAEQHAALFVQATRRAGECVALLPTSPLLLFTTVHLFTVMQHSALHVPSIVWRDVASQWSALLLGWLAKLSDGDRMLGAPSLPITLACLRALTALSGAARTACTSLQQQQGTSSSAVELTVLPQTQMEASLGLDAPSDGMSSAASASASAVSGWSLSEEHALAFIADVHRQCVAQLQHDRIDRNLQSGVLICVSKLYSLFGASPASSAPLRASLTQSEAPIWGCVARLIELQHSRVAAAEAFHCLVRMAPVPASQGAAVRLITQQLVQMIKQRDRALLRVSILSLHSLVLRILISSDRSSGESVFDVLQQAIQPIVAFATESGEVVVEQTCALVLLANVLRLLSSSSSSPLRSSTMTLVSSQVFPALTAWLHANSSPHPLGLAALSNVYESAALLATPPQRDECVATLRNQAEHAKEEGTRASFAALLAMLLLSLHLTRSSSTPFDDLGARAMYSLRSGADSQQALAAMIGREEAAAQQAEASLASRIVVSRTMGAILFALASLTPADAVDLSSSLRTLLAGLSGATDADSPLVRAFADALGQACAGGCDSAPLVQAWRQNSSSASLTAAVQQWSSYLTAVGVAHIVAPSAAASNAGPSSSSSSLLTSGWRASADAFAAVLPSILSQLQTAPIAPESVSAASALLGDLCVLAPSLALPSIAERLAQSALPASAVQVQLDALQRFVDMQQAQCSRWRLRLSTAPVSGDGNAWPLFERAFVASLATYASADLPVLLSAVRLLDTILAVRPSLLQPHLPSLLARLSPLVAAVRASFVREVSYGPSTKLVDGGVELRQAVWRCLTALAPLLSLGSVSEATAAAGVVHPLLLSGLGDPSPDVRVLVHASVIPLVSRVVLSDAAWSSLSGQLVSSLQAAPPENAVREEMLAHAEVVQSAGRAAKQLIHVMQQAEQFPDTTAAAKGSDAVSPITQARQQLQAVIDTHTKQQ